MLNCLRCGHEWQQKKEGVLPRNCPGCNSPYWQNPKKDAGPFDPADFLWRREEFGRLSKGIPLHRLSDIIGRSYSTTWKYTKAGNIPMEVIDRLAKHQPDLATEPPRQFTCMIPGCGYQWTAKKDSPSVCPKCHNRHWKEGISPAQLKAQADRLFKASAATFQEFAAMIGTTPEKLVKYYGPNRLPMNQEQLAHIEKVLRERGLWRNVMPVAKDGLF